MSPTIAPADALLVVDIGNTHVGIATWDAGGLHGAQRVDTQDDSGWRPAVESAWVRTAGIKTRGVVVASVCPARTRPFLDLAGEICGLEPACVRDDIPLPLDMDIDSPEEIGVDRVCSAAAAYDHIGGACAIASFGTATTIDCVSAEGRFLGGVIMPGLQMACDALHEHTAQLPSVKASPVTRAFGRNTREAIISGVTLGAAGALREVVERFATELGSWPQLVITGGGAPIVAESIDFADSHVPDLCLMGIALAYRKAAG